jgi:tellurite resistance protein TerC
MPPEAPSPTPAAPIRARSGMTALACVLAGLGFGAVVWLRMGAEPAQQYLAGYLIELSLSVDNVFVFALVFDQFGVDPRRQRSLLFWGIAGAIVLRTALILAGMGAIGRFAWIIPVFGAIILATGVRLLFAHRRRKAFDPAANPLVRLAMRLAPASLAALVVLETADLVFALDSLPAVVAVTHDARIAIASNLFAILGLRSLFFVVSGAARKLRYLNVGIAAVLAFVGLKMIAEPWHAIPTGVSLAVIACLLLLAAGASLLQGARKKAGSP